ncbi:MAG: T9SS type A sorting domain-containing protein [Paludibacter sp.]|nr:T9SS type A sorting domain-containing protein [Paludibacter sp.]
MKTVGKTLQVETDSAATVNIFAPNGQLLGSSGNDNHFQIPLASGFYIVQINTENEFWTGKILI